MNADGGGGEKARVSLSASSTTTVLMLQCSHGSSERDGRSCCTS